MIVEINKWVWVKVSDLVDHRYIAIAHPLLGTQFLPCQMNWVVGVASVASYQKGSATIWIKVYVWQQKVVGYVPTVWIYVYKFVAEMRSISISP